MPKRSSKPRDLNSMAAAIVAQSTDDEDQGDDPYAGRNPAAVELGRLGRKKGGKPRAEKLTPERRSAMARCCMNMHDDFARPHMTVSQKAKRPTSPAMAAGVAEYPWSTTRSPSCSTEQASAGCLRAR